MTKQQHDRGVELPTKKFLSSNVSVDTRAPKQRWSSTAGGAVYAQTQLDFLEPEKVWETVDAAWNMTTNLWNIRERDHSGLVMLKVLHDIRWAGIYFKFQWCQAFGATQFWWAWVLDL